jgi:hypothetical protein
MKRIPVLIGILALSLCSLPATSVRVVGSDILADAVGANLTEFASSSDVKLVTHFKGSKLGYEALLGREAELGLLVFAADEGKPGPEFATHIFGYMTAFLVVPDRLPLTQIDFTQLAGIYGANERITHGRWSDIGVGGDWAIRSIPALATSRRVGLAIDLFRYNVLATPDFKPLVAVFDAEQAVIEQLKSEGGGIGILAQAPRDDSGLKVLLVSKLPGEVAYGPTAENLHTGDYPLRLPVYLVFRKTDTRRLYPVLRHLLSIEAAPVFWRAGVVVLPIQARNQLIFDLEASAAR